MLPARRRKPRELSRQEAERRQGMPTAGREGGRKSPPHLCAPAFGSKHLPVPSQEPLDGCSCSSTARKRCSAVTSPSTHTAHASSALSASPESFLPCALPAPLLLPPPGTARLPVTHSKYSTVQISFIIIIFITISNRTSFAGEINFVFPMLL